MQLAVMVGTLAVVVGIVGGCFYSVTALAGAAGLDDESSSNSKIVAIKANRAPSYEEKEITVTLSASSVEADLEVQILGAHGELLTGYAFELVVTYPNGNTKTWPITEMDGFLYLTRLKEGKYTVEILPMDGFIMPSEVTECDVKPAIKYEVIDVSDKIVDEKDINVATEDKNYGSGSGTGTVQQDTVPFVASSKTEKIVKEDITTTTYTPKTSEQNGVKYLLYANETVSDIIVEENAGVYTAYRLRTVESSSDPSDSSDDTSSNPSGDSSGEDSSDGDSTGGGDDSSLVTPAAAMSFMKVIPNQQVKEEVTIFNADGTGKSEYAFTENTTTTQVEKKVTVYTGWQTINGNTYYYKADGTYITGFHVIQGKNYFFDNNGVQGGALGIDVSKYQGNIDWVKVRDAGVKFVFIRCGYRGYGTGALVVDPYFYQNIQGATAAGLKVGVYFFSQAITTEEAVEEASLCISLVKGYNLAYPIAFDTENTGFNGRADGLSTNHRTQIAVAFCETVRSAGYTPCVYASKSWFMYQLTASSLNNYKIWLAHYTNQTNYTGKYDIWQYSSTGSVNGIKGNVDMNFSYMGY